MTRQLVIGVDGGGSTTRVAIATSAGEVLGVGRAGSGNYHDVGIEKVRSHITAALDQAWQSAEVPRRRADATFLGLASVVAESDRNAIRRSARGISLAPEGCLAVDHDLSVALAGGLVGQPGIVLIVGTGASCFGQNADGRTWRAGGWGPILDDIGSSRWLGLQAMVATVREIDGRGQPTVLRAQIIDALQLDDVQQIQHRIDSEGLTRRDMATLGQLVTTAAAAGDTVAQQIIAAGVEELALLVATVADRLQLEKSLDEIPVAVTGGLTSAGQVFLGPLQQAVTTQSPQCELVEPKLPPVLGGVLLALGLLDIQPNQAIINNLINGSAIDSGHIPWIEEGHVS